MTDQAENTDREIWRGPDEGNGSYYADSIHVTADNGIGINVGGHVIVMPAFEWHALATGATRCVGVAAGSNMRDALQWIADHDTHWTSGIYEVNGVEVLERSSVGNIRVRGQYGKRALAALASADPPQAEQVTDEMLAISGLNKDWNKLYGLLGELYEWCRGCNDFRPDSNLGRRVQSALRPYPVTRPEGK